MGKARQKQIKFLKPPDFYNGVLQNSPYKLTSLVSIAFFTGIYKILFLPLSKRGEKLKQTQKI